MFVEFIDYRQTMVLALFDFDGTLIRGDSLFGFCHFVVGSARFYLGILRVLPQLVLFKLGRISATAAKERYLTFFLAGKSVSDLQAKCQAYQVVLRGQEIPQAVAALKKHVQNGDTVAVVSASCSLWIKDWCISHDVPIVLATELNVVNGKVTGRLVNTNCQGPEKVRRILEQWDLQTFEKIVVYGDSRGDKEMLDLGQEAWLRGQRLRG